MKHVYVRTYITGKLLEPGLNWNQISVVARSNLNQVRDVASLRHTFLSYIQRLDF